ncbi:MAG: hypothetical protein BWX50_01468 [Euryarchaeota archaeon ADurb.Bin009]|nr:MAG: hypothetical protein BWX50_01468 [Euryarchaeota archaeon ADurb.Bin009]
MVAEDGELLDIPLDLGERLPAKLFVLFPFGDISSHRLDADHLPVLEDRRLVQLDERHEPIFPVELDLEPLDRFAPGQLLLCLLPRGERYGAEVIAAFATDQLLGRVTEHAGHRRGYVGDPAVVVAGVDHIEAPLRYRAELLFACEERLLGCPPLDRLRENVCRRLYEVDVILREPAVRPGVGAEHPIGCPFSLDDDADPAHDPLVPEEGRAGKTCLGPEILDDNRFMGEERVACL